MNLTKRTELGRIPSMNALKPLRAYLLVCGLVVVLQPLQGLARQNSGAVKTGSQQSPTERDGQHDFDFEIGTWKTHVSRLQHPLTGSTAWVEYEGTTVVRKVWNGRANLAELEADGPAGQLVVLSLRLYDPQSHQWSLNTSNSKSWNDAASYLLTEKTALPDALTYANRSIENEDGYENELTKSQVLTELNRKDGCSRAEKSA